MAGLNIRVVSLLGTPSQLSGASTLTAQTSLAATAITLSIIQAGTSLSFQSGLTSAATAVRPAACLLEAVSAMSTSAVRVARGATLSMSANTVLTCTPLPINRFVGPTFEQTYTTNILLGRYGIDTGRTVIVTNGVVTITEYPYQEELEQADFYLLGGHRYQLTETQTQTLINAGHADLVETA